VAGFRIEWNEKERADVRVYDISGRTIGYYQNLESGAMINNLNLSRGVYLVEISVDESSSTQKLIVN